MNNNSPGIKTLISELNKKTQEIALLQQAIDQIKNEKGIETVTADTYLEQKLIETQKLIKEKEFNTNQKIKNQYKECLELKASEIKTEVDNINDNYTKILITCENVIKFVENNYAKLKLLYQIPMEIAMEIVKGDVKLSMALDLAKLVLDSLFDSETIKNIINYLCRILFPKTIENININNNSNMNQIKKKSKIKKIFSTIRTDIR